MSITVYIKQPTVCTSVLTTAYQNKTKHNYTHVDKTN